MSKNRKLEIENKTIASTYRQNIRGFNSNEELEFFLMEEQGEEYSPELSFIK